MNAYIFTFAWICEAIAFEALMEHCDVGTVLFSRSALSKSSWTADQIAVLRARKHFLDIMPPIHALDTHRGDFTNNMHKYFKDTIAEAKNEAVDPETDKVMSLALSDAIGGYLKMWILPIAKFSYYGGTVPAEDALKLYQFHDDIKQYLKTDGKGWRDPTSDFLYSMSINIAPVRQDFPRTTQYPCEDIAYFERTKAGLAIPVPSITWEKGFECMFFPIKNQGPISLNFPDSSDTLLKYYNVAISCIVTSNLEELDSFEDRFQKWLDGNVIPHLKDEKLYPALRSVLSLVNKSKAFDTAEVLYHQQLRNKTYVGGIPIDLSSKKMMVITIIIILEIAWCIPTLCYLMFTKMKKKKQVKLYYRAENKNNRGQGGIAYPCSACTITNAALMTSKQVSASPSVQSRACLNEQNNRFDVDVETCFPQASQSTIGTATRSNFICQLHPAQIEMNDQAISRKPSRQLGASIGKSVSINISNSFSPDKTSSANSRPHVTPVYDSSRSKTSINSFTRYKIKKASSSFVNTCCCKKRSSSSSTTKGSWCNCNKSSSFQSSSPQLECVKDSSQFSTKDSSTLGKKDSSSSLIKSSFCNCTCKKDPSSLTKTSCSDSNCECFNCIPEEDMASTTGSLSTVQNLQPTQTVTLLQGSVSSVDDTKTSSYIHFVGSNKKETHSAQDKKIKKSVTISSVPSSQEISNLEPDMNTNKEEKRKKKCVTIASLSSSQTSSDLLLPASKQIQSIAIEKASKQTMIYAAHKVNKLSSQNELNNNKKDLKLSKPLLEITIDRTAPPSDPGSPAKSPKPSKIPKRFFTHTVTQTRSAKGIVHSNRKSLIPQRKKHVTLDDIIVHSKKSSHTEKDKLNMTL